MKKAVYGNIGKPEDVQAVVQNGGEGIGLFRTEFLFMDRMSRPTEAEQFEAYATVAKAMNGREVIIRTLDIGGDKEIPYLEIEKEDNPFLGHRAIRYCLDHPDLFCDQIRAILRAAKFGDLKLMLPLITCKEEILAAKELIEQCLRELIEAGEDVHPVPVGIMVETPAAALTAAELAKEADFFSIGTNDLTGYVMAVDRGNQAVARLYDPMQPAVLSAIEMTIKDAKRRYSGGYVRRGGGGPPADPPSAGVGTGRIFRVCLFYSENPQDDQRGRSVNIIVPLRLPIENKGSCRILRLRG